MAKSTRLPSTDNRIRTAPYFVQTRSTSTRRTPVADIDDAYTPDDPEFVLGTVPLVPKAREICTPEQRLALLKLFERTKGYPTSDQQLEISQRIGKSRRSIQVWFQNQRHPRDKSKMADFVKQRIQSSPRRKSGIKPKTAASRRSLRKRRDSMSTIDDTSDVDTSGSSAIAPSPPPKSPAATEESVMMGTPSTFPVLSTSSPPSRLSPRPSPLPATPRIPFTDYQNEPSTVTLSGKSWSSSEVEVLQALELVKTIAWTIPERWMAVTASGQ